MLVIWERVEGYSTRVQEALVDAVTRNSEMLNSSQQYDP